MRLKAWEGAVEIPIMLILVSVPKPPGEQGPS